MTTKPAYHHGDLRAALVSAGLELTREGGPDALTIRGATRLAGVSANAAYRHFRDRQALLQAVTEAIQDQMTAEMARAEGRRRDRMPGEAASDQRRLADEVPASRAVARLRAVGLGYIGFALAEPGWFTMAFFGGRDPDMGADGGRVPPPYVALVDALDALVDAGVLTADQREGAEWPCWSAVHGFAELALRGPLRGVPREAQDAFAVRTVDAIIAGLPRS